MSREEEFRALASQAVQRATDWRREDSAAPSRPRASLEELRTLFAVDLPASGRPGDEIIEALATAAEAGLVGSTRPDFFAWVMGASHPVGVAADWLTTAWGQNAAIYDTSPAAAVAEEVVADWLLDLLQLPAESSVGFTTGATMASTICLAAARSDVLRRAGYDLESNGVFAAPEIRVYLGREAHATLFSGLRYLGFGEANLVSIDVDSQGRMQPEALAARLVEQVGPKIVICQAGHINSGNFDPLPAITALAHDHDAWCHVDGAFGLWARAAPGLRQLAAGAEGADSWAVDGHKWLQVPYDSAFAIVRNRAAHLRAMDTSASYLNEAPGDGRSPSKFSPELSRRARGFAVWAVLQALGREGIAEMVERHCRCARELQQLLAPHPDVEILNEVVLNQLAIAFGRGQSPAARDRLTDAVIAELAAEDGPYVAGAEWRGRRILRVSIISQYTDSADIERLAEAILRCRDRVRATP